MAQTVPNRPAHVTAMREQIRQELREHWRFFMFEGVVLIALGLAAIAVPPLASLTATVFLGWLLLIGGAVGTISTLFARGMRGFGWALLSSVLALIAGAIIVWAPLRSVLTLTLVLAAYFFADGIMSLLLAIEHRADPARPWGWLVASGIVDIVLAGIIVSGWPGTAFWVLGLLVGIDLVFGGFALVMVASRARRLPPVMTA